jgi:YVTN family beta-propeller protein
VFDFARVSINRSAMNLVRTLVRNPIIRPDKSGKLLLGSLCNRMGHCLGLRFSRFGRLLQVIGLVTFLVPNGSFEARLHAADSKSGGMLLVCNKGDKSLGIIDPRAGRQIATVAEQGETGHEVVASPDGKRAFVPIYGNSGVGHPGTDGQLIRVIDLAGQSIVGTFDFGKGVRPHCAVFGPKNGLLYVTTELDNSVSIIDPQSLKLIGTVPTGQPESHMLAITRDGRRGYTSNVGPGTVSALDLEQKKLVTIIPICPTAQRVSLSADDRWAFTSDQTKPRLAVIDTSSNKLKSWIEMPGIGYGTAVTPDGRWLLVALIGMNKVGVIDLEAMKLARTLDVPKAPQEVLVRPDGTEAFVSCDASRQVAVLNLKDWSVEKLVDAGKGADGLAWAPQMKD